MTEIIFISKNVNKIIPVGPGADPDFLFGVWCVNDSIFLPLQRKILIQEILVKHFSAAF